MCQFALLVVSGFGIVILILAVFLFTAILSTAIVAAYYYQNEGDENARETIAHWIKDNGWQLIELDPETGTNPFGGFLEIRGTRYCQFIISDRDGNKQIGWAKFGPFDTNRFKIKWVETTDV